MTESRAAATIPEPVTEPPRRPGDDVDPGGLAAVASLGLQLAVSFLLPIAGGIWLDGRWGTSPWCLLLGMLLGLGLAGVALRELIRKGDRNGR